MATLQNFRIWVYVLNGPSREDLFDANRLVEHELRCKFTFGAHDGSRQLKFFNALKNANFLDDLELTARILSAEPLDTTGDNWRVKVGLMIDFRECRHNLNYFFSRQIITQLGYNTSTRKGLPSDRRFVQKCMRWNDDWDENNPGGLWFNREVARL